MSLLDSKCMNKDLHITGLTLLRKIIEVENKELVTPAADWSGEDWEDYQKIILAKQNSLVEIGCIDFLCKHIQEIDDDEILEQTFLVCITLLLGGNQKSQDAFYTYFVQQDPNNIIMMKLKRLLVEQFALTKKFIGEKNAKLAMIYKLNQRNMQKELLEKAHEEEHKKAAAGHGHHHHHVKEEEDEEDENLLTIDESVDQKDGDEGKPDNKVDEMFLVNQTKTQSITRCMRMLRFLQLLTEGHHTELQNYLREQVLLNGVTNQKSFDFVSYLAQMMAMYEKQFINCYSCNLGMQLIDTLIEFVQGPCKQNQRRLVEAKIIDCCRDLIQQGQQSKNELKLRGFTTEQKEEWHNALKMSAIKLLLSLIEGSVDMDIYRQIADSLDDFMILIKRMSIIFDTFIVDDLGLPAETSVEQVNKSLRRDSFLGNIIEGFDIFTLINQLAIALPDVRDIMKPYMQTNAYLFFKYHTGNVEIQKENDIMTIYFPIQPVTRFLTETTKEKFMRIVNRESNQHKIIDLVAKTPEFIDEMEHLEERSHDFIQITPDRLNFFRDFSTLIAICVSFIVICFYKYDRIEKADGSNDYTSTIGDQPLKIIVYLGYCQIVTSMILIVGFCLNKINIIVKSGWRKKTTENK